jgi:hypothetical protein
LARTTKAVTWRFDSIRVVAEMAVKMHFHFQLVEMAVIFILQKKKSQALRKFQSS